MRIETLWRSTVNPSSIFRLRVVSGTLRLTPVINAIPEDIASVLLTRLPFFDASPSHSCSEASRPELTPCARLELHGWVVLTAALDLLGSFTIAVIGFGTYVAPMEVDWSQLWAALGAFSLAWALAARSQLLYEHSTFFSIRRSLRRAAVACILAFVTILAVAFGFKVVGGVSRVWLVSWALTTLLWVFALRIVWNVRLGQLLTDRNGRLCLERVLVFARSTRSAERVARAIEMQSGYRLRAVASLPLPGLPGGASVAWTEDAVRAGRVDRVLIADVEEAKAETNAVLLRLIRLAVDVTLLPNMDGLYTPELRERRIGRLPAIDVVSRPLSSRQALIKRAEDVLVSVVALVLMLPVLAVVSIAIKLDSPGPIVFRQKRVGFHESTFSLWKFRTMYHDMQDPGALRQTSRGDSRVTRVGRFLRRSSIDELPQLVNVLRGDMSVVGPRPHALQTAAAGIPLHDALEEYVARHRLKPGITGWAQVNGCRGEIDSEEKLRRRTALDCFYIENWSLLLDLWIIARTVWLMVFDREAY